MIANEILKKKIGFISLGCDKNRVDLENMIFKIKSAGFEIVNSPELANIVIINTCSFLESARLESIENILDMSKYKNGQLEKIIVTGCLNELNYPDLNESLPEVDCFLNVKDNENIVSKIFKLYDEKYLSNDSNYGRILTTPKHYAYLKIAEGCNNFCTYCLIPYIRGRYKSRTIEDIVCEAKTLVNDGVKEIILVAQDVTKYGVDLYQRKSLVPLIKELSKIDGLDWIRLLYCYPEEIDDDLIIELSSNPKVVKYLDIPLQHVSDRILKSMNRRSINEGIRQLFCKLRNNVKGISLRTTFILGFPGETEDDFNEIIDFIKEFKLENVGFFTYSREEGTKAFDFENQIDEEIKQNRLQIASNVQYEIQSQILDDLIGKVFDVYVDQVEDNYSIARYYGQCPQIDGYTIINEILEVGKKYKVKIINKIDYDLIGERL